MRDNICQYKRHKQGFFPKKFDHGEVHTLCMGTTTLSVLNRHVIIKKLKLYIRIYFYISVMY